MEKAHDDLNPCYTARGGASCGSCDGRFLGDFAVCVAGRVTRRARRCCETESTPYAAIELV